MQVKDSEEEEGFVTVKISDFGMSREICGSSYYKVGSPEKEGG